MTRKRRLGVVRSGLMLGLVAVVLASCAELRRHTYPPDLQYISPQELQGTMHQLAGLVHRLDRMSASPEVMAAHRRDLIALLTQMQRSVSQLASEGVPSNHPLVNANLDAFKDDIREARFALERDPPSYIRAASLKTACSYCHSQR